MTPINQRFAVPLVPLIATFYQPLFGSKRTVQTRQTITPPTTGHLSDVHIHRIRFDCILDHRNY
jgi:hypothetical protein